MVYGVFKVLIGILCICVISSGAFLRAECSIDTIIVSGKVEHAPRKGIVKVQLIYPKDKIGESGDVTVEDGSFRIPPVPNQVSVVADEVIRPCVSSSENKAVRCHSDLHDARIAEGRVQQMADDCSHDSGHAGKSGRIQLTKEAIPDRYFYAAI